MARRQRQQRLLVRQLAAAAASSRWPAPIERRVGCSTFIDFAATGFALLPRCRFAGRFSEAEDSPPLLLLLLLAEPGLPPEEEDDRGFRLAVPLAATELLLLGGLETVVLMDVPVFILVEHSAGTRKSSGSRLRPNEVRQARRASASHMLSQLVCEVRGGSRLVRLPRDAREDWPERSSRIGEDRSAKTFGIAKLAGGSCKPEPGGSASCY